MMNGTLTKENSFVKNRAKLFSCKSEEEPLNNEVSGKKTPSYVSLSCAVSGYSGLNRYDSRARQEISRSRDSSRDATRLPLCLNKSRDSSPVRARYELKTRKSSGGLLLSDITANAASPIEYQQQQQQNQQWNGRSKSVDRGYLRQNFLNGYLQYKPPTSPTSTATTNEERGRVRIRSSTVPHQGTQQDSKSVIQQRIERLYGPAALAGGFFLVKSPLKSSKEPLKSIPLNNNNNTQETTDGCSTPPVFRHLNAEFRQQLKLKDKRSPESTKTTITTTATLTISTTTNNSTDSEELVTLESVETNGVAIPDDGHKFLKILEVEKNRIQLVIAKNELYLLESHVQSSEELTGKVRAAVGKAKLLLAQKFEQFAGLCRKNLTQSPDEQFPTTGQDLAGFWDMVTIQVEHINSLFSEIQRLRENNWEEIQPQTTPAAKLIKTKNKSSSANSSTPVRSAKAQEAAKAREEARRKMMEDRRKLAKAKKNDDWVITEKSETVDLTCSQSISEEMVM